MMAVAIGLVLHSFATEASGHWPGLGSIDEFHNRTGPWVEKGAGALHSACVLETAWHGLSLLKRSS